MNINSDETSKEEVSDRSGNDLNEDDTSGGAIDLGCDRLSPISIQLGYGLVEMVMMILVDH